MKQKYIKLIVIGLIIIGISSFVTNYLRIEFHHNTEEEFWISLIGILITFAYGSGPFFLIAWWIKRQHLKPMKKA